MATYKHLRSSTANKRPTTSIADGQLAINSNAASAGLFFKDSTGATIIKVGPVHVGTTAPNATPGAGGSSGNSTGEVWLDTSLTPVGVKIWNGSAWVNGTPIGSTTVQGLLELATDVETQAGSDAARAVTPASLQSKVSDSTSTTSSTTIASSTAVKSAFDLANAALPKSGGTVTGNLEIGTTGSLTFEGSVADGFETTIAVTNPTADRTITLPDQTGNMLVSGNASIVNADVNASAAIAGTKIAPDFGSQTVQTTGIFSHALGSAGAPTITFTGDTNTGIYSPGADQLAISTAGSGRLFVDASGRVGIGSTGSSNILECVSATNSTIGITRSGSHNVTLNAVSGGAFTVGMDGSGGATERLRITSAGLVGVGTSAPNNKLYVVAAPGASSFDGITLNNGVKDALSLYTTGASYSYGSVGGNQSWIYCNHGDLNITSDDTGVIKFSGDVGVERMRLDASGRLGVGTTPDSRLHVLDASGNSLRIGYNPGTNNFNIYDAAQHLFRNNGGSSEYGRFDSAGRLGIGTSSPGYRLDVNGEVAFSPNTAGKNTFYFTTNASNDASLFLKSDTTNKVNIQANGTSYFNGGNVGIGTTSPGCELEIGGNGHIHLANNGRVGCNSGSGAPEDAYIKFTDSDIISFHTTDTERGRWDSSGRLLVGTSSARSNFFNGSTTAGLQAESTGEGSIVAAIRNVNDFGSVPVFLLAKSRGGTVGSSTIVQSGDQLGYLSFQGADGSEFVEAAQIRAEVDGTPGANDMPGRIVLSTTADGAASPTERMRIDNGGNIFWGPLSGGDYPNYLVADGSIRSTKTYNTTTASAANTFISTNGTLARSTSSIKYKTNVETIEDQYADAILGCRPVWYQSTSEADNPEWGHWGFIAEEVVQIDPRLCFFKEEEDGTLEPEGVQYDRFVPHLLNLIKRQQQAIETLEAKVAALQQS